MKDEANKLFKEGKIKEAVEKFKQCVEIEPLNVTYNATVYLNLAIGLHKNKKTEESLTALNKSIQLNPDYTKAYVKRAEVNEDLKNYPEAV